MVEESVVVIQHVYCEESTLLEIVTDFEEAKRIVESVGVNAKNQHGRIFDHWFIWHKNQSFVVTEFWKRFPSKQAAYVFLEGSDKPLWIESFPSAFQKGWKKRRH